MTELAYALSSEEHDARTLVAIAQRAESAGFRSVWISDHYHPWIDRQGESPFVWSVIGGIAATTNLTVTTGVTCPTIRIHPAVVAQATATCANMLPGGRFRFGVGSGEALNEHILGDRWPPADLRLDMLAEAVELIRTLWTGREVTYRGLHYTVENARLYTTPEDPIPVVVSAFGPRALALAAEIGDGWVTTSADPEQLATYRDKGGSGPALGSFKACWGEDEAACRRLAHELWPTSGIPGQLHQDLPTPAHFEQAAQTVTEEQATETTPCGPDPEPYVRAFREYADAGYDEVAVTQIGPDQEGFFRFYESELRSRLGT
ncbi:MAG TPA: TIGR03557 family F420-dependent LLM class oxidoreductase [Acidimicrobiales bacterium]|nr:TIGR03557 family F420-dependent LLM class oxidoreductase [Acidimicrobiales bacterium]